MKHTSQHLFLVLLAWGLWACSAPQPQYRIGVSQCLDDAWRQKMNREMERELLLHPDMTLATRVAHGSSALQCAQIDSFIAERVDLLIVSPNESDGLTEAVARAYDAGIPVIVADRRVHGDRYTAFLGGDNYQVGRKMAEWVDAQRSGVRSTKERPFALLEVCGMEGSTPEALRHQGMVETLEASSLPMPVIHSVSGATDAYAAVSEFLKTGTPIDAIVAHNDIMAVEAARAMNYQRSIRLQPIVRGFAEIRTINCQLSTINCQLSTPIMGVDGIYDGLKAIRDGVIDGTVTYPSRGDLLIQTAAQILTGEPFVRDSVIPTYLVDASAAATLIAQYEQQMHDVEILRISQLNAATNWNRLRTDNRMLVAGVVLAGVLFLIVLCALLVNLKKIHTEIKDDLLPQLEDVEEAIGMSRRDEAFMERVKEIADAHLTDPQFGVEELGAMLQLSRAQLFRRIKKITGLAPMDYIRERRLLRADELLRTTDMTIRQISLELCFNKPAYFSKYYKDYFGYLPSEQIREMK